MVKLPVADIWSDVDPAAEISSRNNLLAFACKATGCAWYSSLGVTSLSSSSNTCKQHISASVGHVPSLDASDSHTGKVCFYPNGCKNDCMVDALSQTDVYSVSPAAF